MRRAILASGEWLAASLVCYLVVACGPTSEVNRTALATVPPSSSMNVNFPPGSSELEIATCSGYESPPGIGCRQGPNESVPPAAIDQSVTRILQNRATLARAKASVTQDGAGRVRVITTLPLHEAIALFATTAHLYFATPLNGAPNPSDPAFVGDQQNHYLREQFGDPLYYPPGDHWKLDNNIQPSDIASAELASDANGRQIAVRITFDAHAAQEWSKLTEAAHRIYLTDPESPLSRVAIFLDDGVLSAPHIVTVGQRGQTLLTDGFTPDTAKTLAIQIDAGELATEIGVIATSTT